MNELELCNVSVANVPLGDAIPAAAAAGFRTMSVTAQSHVRCGMDDDELAALLDANGIRVHDVEASFDWLAPADTIDVPWIRPVYDTGQLLDVASALGATTLVAIHFGPPRPLDEAAEAFAALCDRAGDRGLRVALEFAPIATIRDLDTAWTIVRAADRANGGVLLDLWHHRRSLGDDALLDAIPADRIFTVQLSDGAAEPEGTLLEDIQRRRLPGQGEFGVVEFVRRLQHRGVTCPIGVEAFDRELVARGLLVAMETLYGSLAGVVADAGAG